MEQPKDRGYAYAEEEGYQEGARPKQDVLRQRYSGASGARRQKAGSTAAAMVQVHASTTSTSSSTTNQDPNRITPVADTVG